tara:strand:- start:40 stop:423 length:384 start_codon:yes stop_codon:yes gene_type:complete
MASILRVNTLTDASSNNSTAMSTINQGTAKFWVNFNGTGTIAARDSFNLSSLTDNGTGDYTATFTNAMGNANHAPQGVGQNSASTGLGLMYNPFSVTTTNTQMKYVNNDAAARDSAQNHVLTNGDLA